MDSNPLRPFRAGVSFSFFNAITWQIALGTPMVLFAENLGASTFIVGVVYSFVFLMAPLEVAGSFLLPRFGYKRLMMTCWALRSSFLIPLIWLAWKRPESGEGWALWVFVGGLFLFCFFRSWGNCCFIPWMYAVLPKPQRGSYFGSVQLAVGLSSIGTLFLCSALFQWMDTYEALTIEFSLALFGSILGLVAISALPDAVKPNKISFLDTLSIARSYLLRPSRYRYFLILQLVMTICASSLPPFIAYYLKVEKGMEESGILSLVALQSVGVLFAAYFVKMAIDKSGPRSIFLLSLSLYCATALIWSSNLNDLTTGFPIYATAYVVMGVAACFWFSANMNYLPLVIDEAHRPFVLAVHSCIVSVASGLSPIIWGFLLKAGSDGLPSINQGWFSVFFIALFLTSIGLIYGFMRVRIPEFHGESEWGFRAELIRPFRAITFSASSAFQSRQAVGKSNARSGKEE